MTEFSGLWTTSGTPSGDQQTSYTQAQLSIAFSLLSASSKFEGISPDYSNELAPTDGGANTVNINTGGAIVDGKYYNNDANVGVNIPSAVGGGNTRIDRIVLRASWSGFTVRIYRIAGTDAASPTVPTITQTSGSTYDIYLAQVLVDTGGDVTVTDERHKNWAGWELDYRQGGDPTDWTYNGTVTYNPLNTIRQAGSINWSGASASTGTKAITFPQAFSDVPLVFITGYSAIIDGLYCSLDDVTASGCTVYWKGTGSTIAVTLLWFAIGPE